MKLEGHLVELMGNMAPKHTGRTFTWEGQANPLCETAEGPIWNAEKCIAILQKNGS